MASWLLSVCVGILTYTSTHIVTLVALSTLLGIPTAPVTAVHWCPLWPPAK